MVLMQKFYLVIVDGLFYSAVINAFHCPQWSSAHMFYRDDSSNFCSLLLQHIELAFDHCGKSIDSNGFIESDVVTMERVLKEVKKKARSKFCFVLIIDANCNELLRQCGKRIKSLDIYQLFAS